MRRQNGIIVGLRGDVFAHFLEGCPNVTLNRKEPFNLKAG